MYVRWKQSEKIIDIRATRLSITIYIGEIVTHSSFINIILSLIFYQETYTQSL